MTTWGIPPVAAAVDTGGGQHRLVWDGDTLSLLDHDESDAVLDALGSPSCVCFAVAAGWSALRSEPHILLPLLDPPSSLAPGAQELFEIEAFVLGEAAAPPAPLSSKNSDERRRHSVKDHFLAALPLLPFEFRTALLRAEVDAIRSSWRDAVRRPETATAIQHLVLVALRRALPNLALHDMNITLNPGTESEVVALDATSIAVRVGDSWLADIAAQDLVADWWNRATK